MQVVAELRCEPMFDPSENLTRAADVGMESGKLDLIRKTISHDIESSCYDGASILIARHGKIVMHEAIGYADRATHRPAKTSDVYAIQSVSKGLTAAAMLQRIEKGDACLNTPVADIIPEFGQHGKESITIHHILTHTSGIFNGLPPIPPEHFGNLEIAARIICSLPIEAEPGTRVMYNIRATYCILGEVIRRLDGGNRSFRQVLAEDLFAPLGMHQSAFGMQPELEPNRVPIKAINPLNGMIPKGLYDILEQSYSNGGEIPSGSGYSTAYDLFRFVEMLRCGGNLDGQRILSPGMVKLALSDLTGDKANEIWAYARQTRNWPTWPAFLGLGYWLRGTGIHPTLHGLLASPESFGNSGLGSTVYWCDPQSGLVFVCLTAGLIEDHDSYLRWQKLADFVHASVSR